MINIRNMWHKFQEHKTSNCDEALVNVLRAAFPAYYQHLERPVIFDKGRAWPESVELLENILQRKAKIILTLRPIPEVLASYEKQFRKTIAKRMPPHLDGENYIKNNTIALRADFLMGRNNIVGRNYERLQEVKMRPDLADRFLPFWYDDFMANPDLAMRKIYDFIGEEYYQHDFDNVEQYTKEDDRLNGHPDLHTIKPKVAADGVAPETILGKEVCDKYRNYLKKGIL
jgi:sulfotransferase